MESKWSRIGGTLLIGLFVAYLDRTNLSVALPQLSKDMGFAGDGFAAASSLALTIFLIGYALANVFGGVFTYRIDPKKIVIWTFLLWSLATLVVGASSSLSILLACRLALGVMEGIYWPQQSRFARAWFAPEERTLANSVIQYYGQYIALAIGFLVLTPIYNAFGWRVLFWVTGGIGVIFVVPLYIARLRPESEAPYAQPAQGPAAKLTWESLGGTSFVFLVISYITQGMLFWGITLWIPLAVQSLGFTGTSQALASAIPYFAALALTYPMAKLSDRTGKRVLIAALGQILPGALLLLLPQVSDPVAKLTLITVAMGFYASSYTPNIWSILQEGVRPQAVGPAAGIMNGLGAGGGGTLAGFMVGLLKEYTGSYDAGFMVLGAIVILGGLALLVYGRLRHATDVAPQGLPAR
jgi:MFS family permease